MPLTPAQYRRFNYLVRRADHLNVVEQAEFDAMYENWVAWLETL